MITQTERVYLALKASPLTSMGAYNDLGCVHLPRRIKDLKELGVQIRTVPAQGLNRFGTKVHYNIYSLEEGSPVPGTFVKTKKPTKDPFLAGVRHMAKVILGIEAYKSDMVIHNAIRHELAALM